MTRVYLDHNATTPVREEAIQAMVVALREIWGNPSSVHWAGAAAREAVARARAQVASLCGVSPETIVFTSGATESNNLVLRGVARRAPSAGDEIVSVESEHPAVLETLEVLRDQGLRTTLLPVDSDGRLDPERFSASLSERTLLASVMWVNNETGVCQPIAELARAARSAGVEFHTDAVQALGKVPIALGEIPVDYASFAAHKLGGPKGVGAVYFRDGLRLAPLLRGGGQEGGRRPGTENVPGIVGFGAACEAAAADRQERGARLEALRDRIYGEVSKTIPDVYRNGSAEHCVDHVLNLSFVGADAETLVEALDLEGFAVASGAACHSGSTEPSHVLRAMGLSIARGKSAIRISLGASTTAAEVDAFVAALPAIVKRVREADL